MNILFLVHVEEMFRQYFPDKMYVNRLIKACQSRKYSQVFLMVSGIDNYEPIQELTHVTNEDQWIDWGWGYEHDMFNENEQKWVIPALGHEYTWVPPELRNMHLETSNIFVGGGYESECLQDFLDCLNFLSLDFTKIPGYVYG